MKNYLSYGGGVNSTALLLLMTDLGMDFEAVYVDHGCDWPETIAYVDMLQGKFPITVIMPEYKREKGKIFNNLYDFCEYRHMIPAKFQRWCTANFKVAPLNRYFQPPAFIHIGIDAGEKHRAKIVSEKGLDYRYLLIEHDVDRQGCIRLIESHGLPVPIKSGCYFCPFQRIGQWKLLRNTHPCLFKKAVDLEKQAISYAITKGKRKDNLYLVYKGKTLEQIISDKQSHLWEEMDYPPCQCGL